MSVLNNSNAIETGGYNIQRSLRFRSSASAYLNRTFTTPTNNKIWTWSGWVKLGALGVSRQLLSAGSAGPVSDQIFIGDTNIIRIYLNGGYVFESTQVLRDPSAFYHLIVATDTTQATAANRTKVYLNGQQITAYTGTAITQNADTKINSAVAHYISRYAASAAEYFDGYLAEVNFIDGQALTPSSFGQTDPVTGVWTPKKYTGTYGTNGFYLPFSDNTSATTLAYDKSGNGNNWTPNNISTTAGATYDSMTDVPTLTSATAANTCTLNPLDTGTSGGTNTITNGNLSISNSGGNYTVRGTFGMVNSGKYYGECINPTTTSSSNGLAFGLAVFNASLSVTPNGAANRYFIYADSSGYIFNGTTTITSGLGTFASGAVLQFAYDASTGYAWVGKNNVWYNSTGGTTGDPANGLNPTFTLTVGTVIMPCALTSNQSNNVNFGQRPFSYTPPTGFKALNTFNLPDPTIKKPNQYMDATTYTGTGAIQSVTNSGSMQPDLVWIKARSVAYGHVLSDSVRGVSASSAPFLVSSATDAEYNANGTVANRTLTSLDANGFTLGADSSYLNFNASGKTYVGWQWKAGGTSSSNTDGSITSTVSKNTTAGFSVVTWTGTGALATVGHGLGVAPKLIINKQRDGGTYAWNSYHASLGNTYYIALNNTSAADNSVNLWNSTSPTSSVFTVNSQAAINPTGGTMVSYCWAEIAGFSKFGSYTGNGSADGPFVYCGFRPKYVMIKRTDAVSNWSVWDTSRSPYNSSDVVLSPNISDAEQNTSAYPFDIVSNGIKIRNTGNSYGNTSGGTYIYAAFAENPQKFSLAR